MLGDLQPFLIFHLRKHLKLICTFLTETRPFARHRGGDVVLESQSTLVVVAVEIQISLIVSFSRELDAHKTMAPFGAIVVFNPYMLAAFVHVHAVPLYANSVMSPPSWQSCVNFS